MYHLEKFHADRRHRRRDICNRQRKKPATNIAFRTNVWRVRTKNDVHTVCTSWVVRCGLHGLGRSLVIGQDSRRCSFAWWRHWVSTVWVYETWAMSHVVNVAAERRRTRDDWRRWTFCCLSPPVHHIHVPSLSLVGSSSYLPCRGSRFHVCLLSWPCLSRLCRVLLQFTRRSTDASLYLLNTCVRLVSNSSFLLTFLFQKAVQSATLSPLGSRHCNLSALPGAVT